MALSGTIYGSTNNQYIDVKIEWSAYQSVSDNTSTITASLQYMRNNSGFTTRGTLRGGITLDGETLTIANSIAIHEYGWTEAGSITKTVYHNFDGTKSVSISATGYINSSSLKSTSISGVITLDTIDRNIAILGASNFTDEENPTIIYKNPPGNTTTTLQACISLTGAANDIAYRDISKTGSTYTFILTQEERNVLRQATEGKNRTIRFYVRGVLGGQVMLSYVQRILTITDANPIIAPSVIDSNSTTIALTGDNNKLIKYYSNAAASLPAVGQKYASITSKKIQNGNKTLTADGTFEAIENGTFSFTVIDSRGFSTSQTVNKPVVDYIKLTCDVANKIPTADGKFTYTVSGNYFNQSFGAINNSLSVNYRYKKAGGEYSAWASMTVNVSDNSYTAIAQITGLDYRSSYTFQAQAIDKLSTKNSVEKTVQSTPVFDWSGEDFKFNVPVEFAKGFTGGSDKILWEGATVMGGGIEITLTEKIDAQMNGVVLVFCSYQDGTLQDDNYQSFYIPKTLVSLKSGCNHNFTMTASNFQSVATKTLKIENEKISGNMNNQLVGAANGITYKNYAFALCYVLGV